VPSFGDRGREVLILGPCARAHGIESHPRRPRSPAIVRVSCSIACCTGRVSPRSGERSREDGLRLTGAYITAASAALPGVTSHAAGDSALP